MVRMGFTHHPGPLPFATIRDAKWDNRLVVGQNIEIHGEHGCSMKPIAARVMHVIPYKRNPPPELATVYAGRRLCMVFLDVTDERWVKRGESWYKLASLPPLDQRDELAKMLDG